MPDTIGQMDSSSVLFYALQIFLVVVHVEYVVPWLKHLKSQEPSSMIMNLGAAAIIALGSFSCTVTAAMCSNSSDQYFWTESTI
jgi:quinol-cytochrome oxidoreductase complex cytochrome b subunit